jgi:predicted CoA-binding protein
MNHDSYDDTYLRGILRSVRVIAMVGASPHWNRPSYFVMKYLQTKGFRVVPVNPVAAGQSILGEACQSSLSEVPVAIDMVDVFRGSIHAPCITAEAIRLGARVVWMQIGVRNDEAAAAAEAAGLQVVMNRCPKIEYSRLVGELGWNGVNTGVISARRRRVI